jgi:hypothetical protein
MLYHVIYAQFDCRGRFALSPVGSLYLFASPFLIYVHFLLFLQSSFYCHSKVVEAAYVVRIMYDWMIECFLYDMKLQ